MAYKWSPKQCDKDTANANQVVFWFLARTFATDLSDLFQSFSSQPLQLHHWPPDLVTWKTRCLELILRWRAKETGALVSSPSHLPSWSLARRLLPSCPNTRYCLGIHVTLTEETGAVTPLSHVWTVPLVEDMLCYGRTGLTKSMLMGPGRAALFYRRCSLGEGLSSGESRDATFMLTGAGIGLVNQPI